MFDSIPGACQAIALSLSAGHRSQALQTAMESAGDPLADVFAVMAATDLGDVETARRIIAANSAPFVSTALGQIAVGNLDQICGRLSDAFTDYELGLSRALSEEAEDILIYGRICRNLALARFGEHTSLDDLDGLASVAFATGREHLAELAGAFHAAACVILGKPASMKSHSQSQSDDPGLCALVDAASILSGTVVDLTGFRNEVLSAEGVPGAPELVVQAIRKTSMTGFEDWIRQHVDPIAAAVAADDARIFPTLPDAPAMAPMDCARCDGRCCYDGVYVTGEEELRIRAFMKLHPQRFGDVPEAFLEDGEWGFLFHGKRTIRVPHAFERQDFPNHFARTKCVFALPSGECSLQKAATENLCHPWKVKPELCWEFPLIGLFNDNALEKPHYFGEPDPGFYDECHPGYLSFMPCAKTDPEGKSWKRMYRTEFLHYFKVKGVKR